MKPLPPASAYFVILHANLTANSKIFQTPQSLFANVQMFETPPSLSGPDVLNMMNDIKITVKST